MQKGVAYPMVIRPFRQVLRRSSKGSVKKSCTHDILPLGEQDKRWYLEWLVAEAKSLDLLGDLDRLFRMCTFWSYNARLAIAYWVLRLLFQFCMWVCGCWLIMLIIWNTGFVRWSTGHCWISLNSKKKHQFVQPHVWHLHSLFFPHLSSSYSML